MKMQGKSVQFVVLIYFTIKNAQNVQTDLAPCDWNHFRIEFSL